MKKFLSLLLTLCLLLGILPSQALAYVGDILPSTGSTVTTETRADGTLVLQNDYIRVTLNKHDGSLTTSPAATADSANSIDRQKPYCEFIIYGSYGYGKAHPATLRLKSAEFVDTTPNGTAKAIKAVYDLTVNLSGKSVAATTAVYYELVQLKENETSADTWGVLTSIDNIKINNNRDDLFGSLTGDMGVIWGYTLDAFSGMGHANATDGPAIKMSRTVYNYDEQVEISTESSVLTSKVENLDTWQSFSQGTDWCYNYITEVYVDGYTWANPFVGLSGYYENKTIKAYLPDTVSVTPGNNPNSTRVECRNDIGYYFSDGEDYPNSQRFLWGFRNLAKGAEDVPSEPDKVDISINAQRLAAFANGNGGVTVEYVADDAALDALKKQYGNPVALISGEYESKNGAEFTFTGGAALLSPSVTATWDKSNGKLIIKKDGTIEHSGLSLNAPSFKFYQPNSGSGKDLEIKLTQDGFSFEIDPGKNDAVIYVDIPYATAKLEQATADAAGNLVFSGEIGFQTVFEGASFTLEELGYGLNEKNEFTVNGVHATGEFDTAKTLSLELAKVEGEVNTFKGKEKYAFSLELNAFDLFETEAELELTRSQKDGSLLPNTLYFYVAASPGIPLIPPVPVGQLNGGGAGFSNLADTVNGDYFAIPPLKLRGTLKGTYLHLIEGKGDVVIGPSEISLTASDVGIVGTNASIIDSFGYSLKLNGQERTYNGTDYTGIYFVGSEALELDLPNTEIDVFILDTSIELGAFGGTGTKNDKQHLYLAIGANAVVKSKVQVPSDVPVIGGWKLGSWDVDLIVGGQTEFPIKDVSVDEGMKQAFSNIDVYLGAMTGVYAGIIDARLWVLVPNIVETNFRRGGGWDVETKWFGRLPEWDWSEKGVEPVAQAMSLEDSEDTVLMSSPSPTEQAASLEAVGESTPTSNTNSTEPAASLEDTGESVPANSTNSTEQTAPMEDAGESVPANSTNSTEQAASSEDTGESAPANSTNSTEITVSADTDETPYILLAFENTVTEEQIKNSLSVTKQNSSDKLEIHWVNYDTENSEDGQIDENKDINATTDIIHNKTDNKDYRVAILRLKDAGTYQVNTGSLSLDTQKSQGVSIAPFEELELTLNNQQVSGEIKYAEENTKYVLRTYFAKEKGGADYLIDEQEITNSSSISVNIPSMGALAPSGEYYVTSFLMTEKSVESIDENGEKETLTGLVAIDHQQFNTRVSYQNQNQPTAPQTVTLELAGNEIMTATWGAVTDADGYAVTIYQKGGNDWIDTGFGYDLDKETTSINMALTVGGEETTKSKNLSANETYKVGVSAYKTIEGGKYYSAETESAENGVYLPEYTPLDMMLFVNGTTCTADEHGVYRAYVDGKDDVLTVSCTTENVTYKVTRMDKTSDNEISTDSDGAYPIPNFEGNLMFKIDGISEIENSTAKDVTSVFLLVSVDKTAPMLTLSDPVFYADMTTGAYQITGTADAGSKIIYGDDGASVNAGSDGTFTIPGTLDENSGVLSLCAQDSAGNKSTSRFALITKQNTATEFIVTFDGNGGMPSVGSMTTTNQKLTSLPSASQSKHSFDGWYTEKSGGIKITTDTIFHADTIVYAHWTYTGGGGGSSSGGSSSNDGEGSVNNDATIIQRPDVNEPNVPTTAQSEKVKTDAKGNVTITNPMVSDAIKAAKDDAKKHGNQKNGVAVEVPVEIDKKLDGVQITLKADALDTLVKENVKRFTIDTDRMTDFGFTLDTLKELNRQTSGDIILKVKKTTVSSIEAKVTIGNRPVYDISLWEVKNGKETKLSNLNGKTISIAIPYTPTKNEQTGNLYAVSVDGNGKPQWITKSNYNADQKAVIFELTQPGVYGVGYDAKMPAFTDIENHWAKDNILFVVSRGLLNGTSETTFSPNTGMTRGMFVTALGRLAGVDPADYQSGKFTDVKADAYYAPYVNWAAKTGIVSGTTDTTFAPDTNINREQMAVIMKNYAVKLGYTVPKALEAVTFADNASISSWAKEAVESMQQAGILAGKTNNRFDPAGTATRAEVATVLWRFVEIIIDPQTANG
ncbi:S-layer homology domain-containing protein [uncultured Oscillibacter sp.]|uniref:S-layer homology domain-containing protein n=1 Tax=uncultured Oscillibacter sp. TaxID=876091 RepID=UPI00280BEFCB|nr:S-layer homology domain-containing protein [uncultured Oscillibacter sp.]